MALAACANRLFILAFLLAGTSRCTAGSSGVSLTWNASPDTNVAGYAIYFGTNSGSYMTRIDAGTNMAGLIPSLTPQTKYYFTVTAYNNAGIESAPASEIAFTVPTLLQMIAGKTAAAGVTLGFTAAAGHWYLLQAAPDLRNWTTIWQSSVATQTAWTTYQDVPQGAPLPQKFYRLVVH